MLDEANDGRHAVAGWALSSPKRLATPAGSMAIQHLFESRVDVSTQHVYCTTQWYIAYRASFPLRWFLVLACSTAARLTGLPHEPGICLAAGYK